MALNPLKRSSAARVALLVRSLAGLAFQFAGVQLSLVSVLR
jgi:hypothetical protein